jgi:hypothetical protein
MIRARCAHAAITKSHIFECVYDIQVVSSESGEWIPAKPIPGCILMNVGDLLQNFSGGKYPSTVSFYMQNLETVLVDNASAKSRTYL